uniref:Alpha/beta hydrolase fold-3 domain-containing protein n=1 Tax=Oryza punctata TaxID=4537 RepID=A0A0E0LVW2_ORYPU
MAAVLRRRRSVQTPSIPTLWSPLSSCCHSIALSIDSIPAMDPDTEVDFDLSLFLIRYKSGRVHRLMGTARVEAGTDAVTGVTSKDVVIDAQSGLAARLYLPGEVPGLEKLPVIVCIHGGGFVVHSAFSRVHSRFLNTLVAAEGVVAVSVDYSLAPEHPLPTAYDDAWPALGWTVASCSSSGQEPWLAEHGDTARLFVASDSAGANIAHNVTMRAGKDGLPGGGGARIDGMVLLHPFFRGGELVPSERTDPAAGGEILGLHVRREVRDRPPVHQPAVHASGGVGGARLPAGTGHRGGARHDA